MALLQDILVAFPLLTPATRDDGAIATQLSVGRTKTVSPTLVGIGSVFVALGPGPAVTFLQALSAAAQSSPLLAYGLQLLNAAQFDVGSAVGIAEVEAFATMSPALLTSQQVTALLNLAVVPDPVTPQMVSQALEGYNYGS